MQGVRDVGCLGRQMFEMWDVWDVESSGCGMFEMRDVSDVRCLGYGIWDVCLDVGCWFTKCLLMITKFIFL